MRRIMFLIRCLKPQFRCMFSVFMCFIGVFDINLQIDKNGRTIVVMHELYEVLLCVWIRRNKF